MSELATERHYSVREIADMWGISAEKARRMFQDVEGVLKIGHAGLKTGNQRKRPHITLRIPASVLARFHQQWSCGFRAEVKPRGGHI